MPDIGLIIFDCDGVLVDSEPLAMRILLETVAAQGISIDPDTGFREFLGRSLATIVDNINAEYGLHLTEAALEGMRGNLYAAYRRELKPMAGLIDALGQLTLPVCVASSSQMERIRISLSLTGLLARFEPAIVSAAMVANGTPAPDLFLFTANWSPRAAPPPAGIIAAKRAGMRVFAFLGGGHIRPSGLTGDIEALQPTAIFDDMHDLPRLVEREAARESAAP